MGLASMSDQAYLWWSRIVVALAFILALTGCQGMPVDGFNTPPNVWLQPACVMFCNSNIGKEDVNSTGSQGAITTGSKTTTSGGGAITGGQSASP
jgi:hypothetical protein